MSLTVARCSRRCEQHHIRRYWAEVLYEYADEYLKGPHETRTDSEKYIYAQGIQDAAAIIDPEWNPPEQDCESCKLAA